MSNGEHEKAAKTEHTPEPDWKSIATSLAQRIDFAMRHLKANGSGLLLNINDGTSQHWRDYLADGMELIPGVVVDRELMHLLELPRTKQRKEIEALKAKRSAIASVKGQP